MNKLFIAVTIGLLLFTSACQTRLFISDAERISGEWIFSEVKYTKLFSFKTVDVTSDYYAWQLSFLSDKTLTAYNSYLQHDYTGRWEIRHEVHSDYENKTTSSKVLEVYLKGQTNEVRDTSFVLNQLSLTKQKIYGTNSYDKKSYTIRMVKH
jgi:hypothetical protein